MNNRQTSYISEIFKQVCLALKDTQLGVSTSVDDKLRLIGSYNATFKRVATGKKSVKSKQGEKLQDTFDDSPVEVFKIIKKINPTKKDKEEGEKKTKPKHKIISETVDPNNDKIIHRCLEIVPSPIKSLNNEIILLIDSYLKLVSEHIRKNEEFLEKLNFNEEIKIPHQALIFLYCKVNINDAINVGESHKEEYSKVRSCFTNYVSGTLKDLYKFSNWPEIIKRLENFFFKMIYCFANKRVISSVLPNKNTFDEFICFESAECGFIKGSMAFCCEISEKALAEKPVSKSRTPKTEKITTEQKTPTTTVEANFDQSSEF